MHAFACALVALGASASAPASFGQRPRLAEHTVDPLQAIARWALEYRRLGANLAPASDECLAPALASLRVRLQAVAESEHDALVELCDLASIAGPGNDVGIAQGRYVADERESSIRDAARGVLRSALNTASGEDRGCWLATNVLCRSKDQPLPRRIAVAEALIGRHWESTLLALFTSSAAAERGLREVSVTALSGWKSDAVDGYMAGLILRALHETDFLSTGALMEHFALRALPLDSPAALEVANALALASISTDWRDAVRHVPLTRALPNELSIPYLIEALSLWHNRGLNGESSRRVEAVIVHELELRSKRHLGLVAERWASWWKVQRASAPAAVTSTSPASEPEGETEAAFFGLHPCTDRVVFVIDRSGSMSDQFGTDRSCSRYTEALRELDVLLQRLGPRTHFNLILFSDEARVWSPNLKPATPALIEAALRWAKKDPPQGGTMLRPAISRALELDPKTGQPELAKLEADTVIVLCDGATAEGASWVQPLLRAVREATCVRFDCVQIGSGGDGTLQALADQSGGQFVHVDS